MSGNVQRYCLDANVLIEAWNNYYKPKYCKGYWQVLNELGAKGVIFIPSAVKEEIDKTDDDLKSWLEKSQIPVLPVTETVTKCLKEIYDYNPDHERLVDSTKGRSIADPWVIAHAMAENATVVTKEMKITAANSTRVKIPNVCENMGIK